MQHITTWFVLGLLDCGLQQNHCFVSPQKCLIMRYSRQEVLASQPNRFRSDVKRTQQVAITQHHVHCHSLLNQMVLFNFPNSLPSIFNPVSHHLFLSRPSICIPRQSQSSFPSSHSPRYPYPAEIRDCETLVVADTLGTSFIAHNSESS